MLTLERTKLLDLYKALSKEGALYLPIKEADAVSFKVWEEKDEVDLEETLTSKSAKDVFFPQVENLMNFKLEGKRLAINQVALPEDKTILFGVKGCDAHSFKILDNVFLAEPKDEFYESRRKNATIITLACNKPEETCFCQTFGTNPAKPEGDIAIWLDEANLYWEPLSEKGKALTQKVESLFSKKGEEGVKAQQEKIEKILAKLPLKDFAVDKKWAQRESVFNSPSWKKLSDACLGCGTCTFVCPTCHCYDIRDFESKGNVERYRCWDSCMYSDFTKMAGGQPRTTQLARFRQRFMHKLTYYPENYAGTFACVGCGRCLQKCPIGMNIVKVEKALVVKDNV